MVFARPESPKVSAQTRRDIQSAIMDNDINRLSSSSMNRPAANTTANMPIREPQVSWDVCSWSALAGRADIVLCVAGHILVRYVLPKHNKYDTNQQPDNYSSHIDTIEFVNNQANKVISFSDVGLHRWKLKRVTII